VVATMSMAGGGGAHTEGKLLLQRIEAAYEQAVCSSLERVCILGARQPLQLCL
jgi:hypothetical protein